MKQILIVFLFIIALSCKEENKNVETQQDKEPIETVTKVIGDEVESQPTTLAFLKDVKSLERDTSNNPIEHFKKLASSSVKEMVNIKKDNIKDALEIAANFKYAVVIVENHTVIKISDLSNCKPSGAWSACMPKGEGYIKKGELVYQNDYINNIIGLPDNQERVLYLF